MKFCIKAPSYTSEKETAILKLENKKALTILDWYPIQTINDVVYTLEADTPAEISLTNINVRLKIQLGQHAEGETFLGDCSFTISDFSVTPASAAE